jgi:hypothetical protein
LHNKLLQAIDFCCPPLEIYFEILAIDDTGLLFETLIDFLELLSILFEFALLVLLVV